MLTTVPFVPWVTAVIVSASFSTSLSLPSTAIVLAPLSSATVAASSTATGASFTAPMLKLAVAVSPSGSAAPLVVPLSVAV